MIYWQNRILTNVKTALGSACTNVVSTTNNMKAVFPACAVRIVTNNAISDDLEFGSEENAVNCGVSVEIMSKTSLSNAITLMRTADSAMQEMGFKRREGPVEVANVTTPDIFRVVARYSRVIGASETINKFTNE